MKKIAFAWHFALPADHRIACPDGCGLGEKRADFDIFLWQLVEACRAEVRAPFVVVSGARCPFHNHSLHTSIRSLHISGCALDVATPGAYDVLEFYHILDKVVLNVTLNQGGLGVYDWGVHIDTGMGRKAGRRWDLRSNGPGS